MRRTVIALLLLMSGAATAMAQTAKQSRPQPPPRTDRCDVGVVSELGTLSVEDYPYHGVDKIVPVESWHLENVVVDRVRAALGNRVAAVRSIPYRGEKVVNRPYLLWQIPVRIRPSTRQLAAGMRCSYYVRVSEGSVGTESGPMEGIGINKGVFIHAVVGVDVIDGDTFKPLEGVVVQAEKGGLNNSLWPDPPDRAGQNTKLREAMAQLVIQNVDHALWGHFSLGLVQLRDVLPRPHTAAP
jgi:hypothetical protein